MFAGRRRRYLVAVLAREGEGIWPSAFLAARRLRFETYGIVEDHLVRRLDRTGVPSSIATDVKPLASFGGFVNRVIGIDPREMAARVANPSRGCVLW